MSFEFYGGILARDVLLRHNCPVAQAESVAEAIIRHQDPVEVGTITTVGLLVQLATQYGMTPDILCARVIVDAVDLLCTLLLTYCVLVSRQYGISTGLCPPRYNQRCGQALPAKELVEVFLGQDP